MLKKKIYMKKNQKKISRMQPKRGKKREDMKDRLGDMKNRLKSSNTV